MVDKPQLRRGDTALLAAKQFSADMLSKKKFEEMKATVTHDVEVLNTKVENEMVEIHDMEVSVAHEVEALHKISEDAIVEIHDVEGKLADMENSLKILVSAESAARQTLEDKVLKEVEPKLMRIVFNQTKRMTKHEEDHELLRQRVQKLELLFNRSSKPAAREPAASELQTAVNASLLPMQASIREIRDEGNRRQTSISNLELIVDALRKDIESLGPNRLKQVESMRRLLVQTKENIDKETAIRELDSQNFSTRIQELEEAAEHIKQEHVSNEELIRKLISEEERIRVLQISRVQESCSKCRWDIEAELKSFKLAVDARLKKRRDDDDILLIQGKAQAANYANFEASLKKELQDWYQFQKNETLGGNSFMQAIASQMNEQMMRFQSNLANMGQMLDQHKMAYEAFKMQTVDKVDAVIDRSKDQIHPNDSTRRALQETLWCLEEEVCDRISEEACLRQELSHVSLMVQQSHFVPERDSQPLHEKTGTQFEAKHLEKVRSLLQNVL